MYIDVKETKKYFLVRMKEAWWPVGAARLLYPTFFLIDNSDAEFHPD